jgi:DNA primase
LLAAENPENLTDLRALDALERLMRQSHIRIIPAIRTPGDSDGARTCIAEEIAKLKAKRGIDQEISEAVQDIEALPDETLTNRLALAAEEADRAGRGQSEDLTEYETAPTGAKINRKEREVLSALLDEIQFSKPNRGP